MHELSIALSMLEQIEEEVGRHNGAAVLAVRVKVGVLSGVDCDALGFAWEIAREGTKAAGAQLEIERVPLLVHCPMCGTTHSAEVQAIFCPRCITPEQDILCGRELELTSLEIDS
jgi:hydrogenase nickel incorporation protein HypA/HybF